MRIAIIIEGRTEKAFLPYLRKYLLGKLTDRMPNLDPVPYNGRIPKKEELKRRVDNLLNDRRSPADHVIALTDVYTGSRPPEFQNADEAKRLMNTWVGDESRFHPHAAQYEFEAWLLPYWDTIKRLADHNKSAPAGNPEKVNHNNPPSRRIEEIFGIGSRGKGYMKAVDAGRILRENDLSVAIAQCVELKAFINTILRVCGGELIP
ncbi:DUF4276 family protein [bacterium]|nr:DUF4276 family protein [bacterium]